MASGISNLDELTNRVMGGCTLEKRIGKDAMGVVYLAEQTKSKRRVAFRILDPKFSAEPSYAERFDMEANAASQLDHPNIVKIYDFGNEGSLSYIVNEFVDGGTVQNLIESKGCLQPEEAIEYAAQVAHGLIAAHQANIIHRDLKPGNFMLTKDCVLKITDFGLAKNMAPDASAPDSGLLMGTPSYMSPEQAMGMQMDSRSDMYSLGVSLYCMVIGDVPFDADSVVGVMLKQISADRPDPCAIKPTLPSVIGSLIMRMMDKDPALRPQNPEELLQELEAVKKILKPEAPPPSLAEISEVPEDQRQSFHPLPANRINRIIRVDASADVLTRIITSIQDDSGVSIETESPFPPNTVIEVRFLDKDKGEEFSGLGLVRWKTANTMGVTFIKVQAIPQGGATRLSGPMAIAALTASPIHQRLLRFVYSNSGQILTLTKIASSLGVGAKMTEDPIRTFERASMIKRHPDGRLEMLWPKDEALQQEIVVWIERHGLK